MTRLNPEPFEDQLMFNRPIPGYAQYCDPLVGLYLCGSGSTQAAA